MAVIPKSRFGRAAWAFIVLMVALMIYEGARIPSMWPFPGRDARRRTTEIAYETAYESPYKGYMQCPPCAVCPNATSCRDCPAPRPERCPPRLDLSTMPQAEKPKPGENLKGKRGFLWEEQGFNLFPFDDMFYPYDKAAGGERSLVLFTGGRSGMDNINQLVTLWGTKHFDYVIFHFDDSAGEWIKFPWYAKAIGITVRTQAKFWYYKRFGHPWLVMGYRYVHFVDSDAGSPEEKPFILRDYEDFLAQHGVMIGQPAISKKGR
jgi:hypothetical protein